MTSNYCVYPKTSKTAYDILYDLNYGLWKLGGKYVNLVSLAFITSSMMLCIVLVDALLPNVSILAKVLGRMGASGENLVAQSSFTRGALCCVLCIILVSFLQRLF